MRRNVLRLALLAPLALGACDATDAILKEPAPLYIGSASLSLNLMSASAGLGEGEWDHADSIAVSVWDGGSKVASQTVAKSAGSTSVQLRVQLELTAPVDTFDVVVEARQGVVSVLRGFADVEVREEHANPADVALLPVESAVDGGSNSSCGLDAAGSAFCWGSNSAGQLGDASAPWIGRIDPIPVSTALGFRDLSVGEGRVCGVDAGGTGAYCWGLNDVGQLGVGFSSPVWPSAVPSPTAVVGGAAFVRVSVGGHWDGRSHFTCGLDPAGTAFCWGGNNNGQLGNGTTTFSGSPVAVSQPVPFHSIDAGTNFACAVGTDDRAYCWGANNIGQIGDGSLTDRLVPTQVSGPQFVDVRAGYEFACGLTATGEIWCWGRNDAGERGDGTWTSSPTPGRVASDAAFRFLDAGWGSACAVDRANAVFCWGGNFRGETGNGTTVPGNNPIPTANGMVNIATVDAGSGFHCAVAFGGMASCWGAELHGQLGSSGVGFQSAPVPVAGLVGTWSDVAPAEIHVCALETSGAAWCWGAGYNGNLGDGVFHSFVQPIGPVAVTGGHVFTSITAGREFTCGLTSAGAAYCWGLNNNGELGDGTIFNSSAPTPVAGGHTFSFLEAGYAHVCGIDTTGNGWCWGRGDSGQLGGGVAASSATPVQVSGIGNLVDIRPGFVHTCATTASGEGYCWGDNNYGQLGIGTSGGTAATPQLVPGFWTEVHAATRLHNTAFSCGLDGAGAAYCWGSSTSCMLGNHNCSGSLFPSPIQVIANGITFGSLAVGGWAVCGLTTAGERYCWGNNMQGQMGVAHTARPLSSIEGSTDPGMGAPVLADGIAYSMVETLQGVGCGVTTAGAILCWGDVNQGLFGVSDLSYQSTPQPVSGGIVFGPGTGL